jgi:hypothetical protein
MTIPLALLAAVAAFAQPPKVDEVGGTTAYYITSDRDNDGYGAVNKPAASTLMTRQCRKVVAPTGRLNQSLFANLGLPFP